MATGVQLKGKLMQTSIKSLALAGTFTAGLVFTAGPAFATGNHDKVTICHATNSADNPYRLITVDESAVDGEGNNDHSHHTGPVFDSEVHDQQHRGWGDIIPNRLNWTDEGQAVYRNGCQPVVPPVEEPPVEEPPVVEPPVVEPPVVQPPVVEPTVTPEPVVPVAEEAVVSASPARSELARTGDWTGLLALTGCLLVAYGWLLRRRWAS